MPEATPLPVLALVRDLLFASKITATARATNTEVLVVREPGQLAEQMGRLLLVDLNLPGSIAAAAEWRQSSGSPVIGFVSHTDAETIEQARAGRLDRVLSRGAFTQLLPELLKAGAGIPARE